MKYGLFSFMSINFGLPPAEIITFTISKIVNGDNNISFLSLETIFLITNNPVLAKFKGIIFSKPVWLLNLLIS